jgi:hypothetical protein
MIFSSLCLALKSVLTPVSAIGLWARSSWVLSAGAPSSGCGRPTAVGRLECLGGTAQRLGLALADPGRLWADSHRPMHATLESDHDEQLSRARYARVWPRQVKRIPPRPPLLRQLCAYLCWRYRSEPFGLKSARVRLGDILHPHHAEPPLLPLLNHQFRFRSEIHRSSGWHW